MNIKRWGYTPLLILFLVAIAVATGYNYRYKPFSEKQVVGDDLEQGSGQEQAEVLAQTETESDLLFMSLTAEQKVG